MNFIFDKNSIHKAWRNQKRSLDCGSHRNRIPSPGWGNLPVQVILTLAVLFFGVSALAQESQVTSDPAQVSSRGFYPATTAAGVHPANTAAGALPIAADTAPYPATAIPNPEPTIAVAGHRKPTLPATPVTLLPQDYNPYDNSQLEHLVQQGRLLQEAGEHGEAIEFFDLAWQNSRVINGLFHASQIPLLEGMLVSEIELEDWQAVDDRYAYIELLVTRLYDKHDARLEAGLQAVSSWHVNAFNLNLDGKREQHLRKAYEVLKLRLEVAENTLPADDPRFAFLKESIRLSETYLYLLPERHRQQLRQQRQAEREQLIATLD